jgi:hypothetical protein
VNNRPRAAFAKVDEDQRLVFGVANMAVTADGEPLEDLQGDVIPPQELEKAMYGYVLESRRGDTMHDERGTAEMVESFVATPEKLLALLKGLGITVDKNGRANVGAFKGVAAWVGYKVTDEQTWADVKSEKLAAFSIGCEGIRQEAA